MNLIVETIRKSDAFEILITSSRGGSQLRNESVGALFLFHSPRVAPGLAWSRCPRCPIVEGIFGRGYVGLWLSGTVRVRPESRSVSSQCVGTPHGKMHFTMTCRTIVDADMRVSSFGQ